MRLNKALSLYMTDGTVNHLLVGGNFTLCSLDSILEYCFKQIREKRASIVYSNSIPILDEKTISQCLTSNLQEFDRLYSRSKNGYYGYHMTITPFFNETIDDNEAIIVAKNRVEKYGTITRPWLLIREEAITPHYHLITTAFYPKDFSYKELSFQERQGGTSIQRGQICPHKACGDLSHCRVEHGQIVNLGRLFDIALKFDYYNFTEFSSILRLQGLGIELDADSNELVIYCLHLPKRSIKNIGGNEMYVRMMLHMRTNRRKGFDEDLLRIERLVSEAFHLGVDVVSYLKEYGIITDLSAPEAPIYIDAKYRRVYEHRDFKDFFTLEKYRNMINSDKWWRAIYNPLNMTFGSSLFPMISFGTHVHD